MSLNLEDKIKNLVIRANTIGLDSFVLGTKNGEVWTSHLEKMKLNDAMQFVMVLFKQVINIEIEKHPEMPADRKAVYDSWIKDFDTLMVGYNERFKSLK